MNISLILSRKFAGAEWTLNGDEYSGLTWLSDSAKPTQKQLEALWPEVKAEIAREQVEKARQEAYQKTSDPIFFEYQRGDATETEWLTAVQAVKDAHPYPEQV
jgi:predicted phosphoribosyltransferase